MNREFMGEYYELKYQEEFLLLLLKQDVECRKFYEEIMELEGQMEEAMNRLSEQEQQLHQTLFVKRGALESASLKLAYLQGAEDREKMLE